MPNNLTEEETNLYNAINLNPDDLPFGITLDDIKAFDNKQKTNKVSNTPIRDVETQDFWDFMLDPASEADDIFTPGILNMLSGGLN